LANRVWFNSNFVRSSWTRQAASVKSQVVFTASEIQFDFAPIEERIGFVFVGRWIPGKGIRTLIKAYSQAGLCPKLHPLVMLGEGPILGECVELVRSNSIQGIQIRGFVSNAEKHECIRRARWLIAPPNTNEDMGLTPLEARSHGVPCIVTRDGGLEEVAGKSALTCAPGDISDLSHALKTATDMSTIEYIERSQETFNSLQSNWQGFSFYPVAYSQVLGIK
jgi:glycosyltransferase involved in cell wall biosynthesis